MRSLLLVLLACLILPQSTAEKLEAIVPGTPLTQPAVYSQYERHADQCPPGHDLYGTFCNAHKGGGRDTRSPAFHLLCRPQVVLPGRSVFSMPSKQPRFRCPWGYFCLSHGLGLSATFAQARKQRSDPWRPGKGPRPTIDCLRFEEGRIFRRPKGTGKRTQARLRAQLEAEAAEASSSRSSIVVHPYGRAARSEAFWRWNNHRRIRVIYPAGLSDTPAASISITEVETPDSDSPDGIP